MTLPSKDHGSVKFEVLPVPLTEDELSGVAEQVRRLQAVLPGAGITVASYVRGLILVDLGTHDIRCPSPAPHRR